MLHHFWVEFYGGKTLASPPIPFYDSRGGHHHEVGWCWSCHSLEGLISEKERLPCEWKNRFLKGWREMEIGF
jgi:hypothetical protein